MIPSRNNPAEVYGLKPVKQDRDGPLYSNLDNADDGCELHQRRNTLFSETSKRYEYRFRKSPIDN